ncbi:MAG: hypothetical protein Q7R68_09395 [Nitrospirales bacterium]|nr:hypothetical protein [Nitrospirales bacterium]
MPTPTLFTAVVVATNINPSIFSQVWLTKTGVFSESDFQAESVLSPFAVNVVTPSLAQMAIPQNLQVIFPPGDEKNNREALLQQTIGRIVAELPHTPFQAVGFNMGWVLQPQDPGEIDKLERIFFLSKSNPLSGEFEETNCHFGCYLSKDFEIGRLKLDIKPVTLLDQSQALQLAFNFHLDLKEEDKAKQIVRFLGKWNAAYKMAKDLANILGKGWSK